MRSRCASISVFIPLTSTRFDWVGVGRFGVPKLLVTFSVVPQGAPSIFSHYGVQFGARLWSGLPLVWSQENLCKTCHLLCEHNLYCFPGLGVAASGKGNERLSFLVAAHLGTGGGGSALLHVSHCGHRVRSCHRRT